MRFPRSSPIPRPRRRPGGRRPSFEALERRALLAYTGWPTVGVYDENVVEPNAVDYVATGSSLSNTDFATRVATAFAQNAGGVIDASALGSLYNFGTSQTKSMAITSDFGIGTGFSRISGTGQFASTSSPNSATMGIASITGGAADEHVVALGLTALSITGRDYGNVTATARLARGGSLSASRHISEATGAGDTFYGFLAPANDYITGFTLSYDGQVYGTPSALIGFDDIGFITNTVPTVAPPGAANDSYTAAKNQTLTVAAPGVLANDTDATGGTPTATLVAQAAHGTVALKGDGSFSYTPVANYIGPDSFTYQAVDGKLVSNTATVALNVVGTNDAPTAADDAFATTQGNALTVAAPGILANDKDINGQALAAVEFTQPAHGSLSSKSDGSFVYTPDPSYAGTDSFTYKASDGSLASAPATVTITVQQPTVGSIRGILYNDANGNGAIDSPEKPLAGRTVYLDQNRNGALDNGEASTTTQADGSYAFANLPYATYYVAQVLPAGWTQTTPASPAYRTVAVGATTPTVIDFNELASTADQTIPAYHKGGYTFDTTVSQATKFRVFGNPGSYGGWAGSPALTSQWVPVTISLTRDDGAPFTLNSMNLSPTWNSVYSVNVTFTGTKQDGTTVTQSFAIGSQLGFHAATFVGFTNLKSVTWAATDSNNMAEFDDVSVQAASTAAAVDVAGVNFGSQAPPVAVPDGYQVAKATPLAVPASAGVLANDTDAAGVALTAVLVAGPAHGTLALSKDGSFTYTPTGAYLGADSFTYQASDGTIKSNVATVSLTVAGSNDAPASKDDSYSIANQAGTTGLAVAAPGVLANDADPNGQALTAVLVAGPSNGTLKFNADGSFTYVPRANFFGVDTFTYRASDGQLQGNLATVSIRSYGIPTAVAEGYSTLENTPLTVAAPGVLANDANPNGGTLRPIPYSYPSNGTLTLNADGSFTYTPKANYYGTDSFSYYVTDGTYSGGPVTDTIAVTHVNQRPVAVDDSYTIDEDATLLTGPAVTSIQMTSQPGDYVGGGKTYNFGPANSTIVWQNYSPGVYQNSIWIDANSGTDFFSFRFQAPNGTRLVPGVYANATRFPFQAADTPGIDVSGDGRGYNTETGSFTVYQVLYDSTGTLLAFAADFTQTGTGSKGSLTGRVLYHSSLTLPEGVLFNDGDVDGDALTSRLIAGPAHGTLGLNGDGSFRYVPNPGFSGIDQFTYVANDGQADSNVATTRITVNQTRLVDDAGFEAVGVGAGGYAYRPAGSAWSFGGDAGVTGNASGFTSGNPAAPEGGQVGFLQGTGTMTQVMTLGAGSYVLSFLAAQRGNSGASAEDFQVLVDGVAVGTFRPTGTVYLSYATATFAVSAGAHTVTLRGLNSAGGDNTAFLDGVRLTKA